MQIEQKKLASMRDTYGETLVQLGRKYKDIVVLDADTAASTRTEKFKKEFPDRFFNFGVAEANMIGVAAGLAACNKKPYASSFAVFGTARVFEQLRMAVCWPNLNVKLVVTHAGISVGEDGASHQSIEDVALMRALPNMKVVVPADAIETKKVILASVNIIGPLYVRLCRPNTPVVFDDTDEEEFVLGKGKVIKDGNDVVIIANGLMVANALEVAELLKDTKKLSVGVVNMSSVKPIDKELVLHFAYKVGRIITAEEHSIIGGLGSAVAEIIAEEGVPCKLIRVGIKDKFGISGSPQELFRKFEIDNDTIIKKILNILDLN